MSIIRIRNNAYDKPLDSLEGYSLIPPPSEKSPSGTALDASLAEKKQKTRKARKIDTQKQLKEEPSPDALPQSKLPDATNTIMAPESC